CCAAVFAGSDSDMPHIEKCQKELAKYGVPSHYRICSAHKQPTRLEAALQMYNKSIEPMAIIASAGGTDALSGTASFLSVWPVVSCPPDPHNPSCIGNPPLSSNVYVQRPGNAARFIAQMFGSCCNVKSVRKALVDEAEGKMGVVEGRIRHPKGVFNVTKSLVTSGYLTFRKDELLFNMDLQVVTYSLKVDNIAYEMYGDNLVVIMENEALEAAVARCPIFNMERDFRALDFVRGSSWNKLINQGLLRTIFWQRT
ncbi:hypothetical protein FOZ63_019663, partial [Perkinsus olseni]